MSNFGADEHFGLLTVFIIVAHQGGAHFFQIRGLWLFVDRFGQTRELIGFKVNEIVTELNDFAGVFDEFFEFLLRDLSVADGYTPVKAREGVFAQK